MRDVAQREGFTRYHDDVSHGHQPKRWQNGIGGQEVAICVSFGDAKVKPAKS